VTAHKAREARPEGESEGDGIDDRPDDVPSKTTLTIKVITDDHYDWGRRDADKVTSKHEGPVNPDEPQAETKRNIQYNNEKFAFPKITLR